MWYMDRIVSDCLVSEFFEINTAREAPAVLF
jgi:hypothetical protein